MAFILPDKTLDIEKLKRSLKDPLWYEQVVPEYVELEKKAVMAEMKGDIKELPVLKSLKYQYYDAIRDSLDAGELALGASGKNWDEDRRPIDTIIVHHTGHDNNLSIHELSAIGLVRLYAPVYAENKEEGVRGKPIWSNHTRQHEPVFWAYHWIVRPDGEKVRLLNDHEIGWHAGEWEVNIRSIAIVLDGNYLDSTPPSSQLESVGELVRSHYGHVDKKRILGHREAKTSRTCPGNSFLSAGGKRGWKDSLLEII